MTRPGPRNDLTDVTGVRVGHAQRTGDGWLSGVTVVIGTHADGDGALGGVDVRGGGPGTRETDLLDPRNHVERVHAVVLGGGSAYGLAAADGVMTGLRDDRVGFPAGPPGTVVPIVPAAILFDLGRGGDPYATPGPDLGREAYVAARDGRSPVPLGGVGAGTGARAGGLRGGVGSASAVLEDGTTVAALVAVNPVGSAVDPATGLLWADPHWLPGDLLPWTTADRLRRPDAAELAAARAAGAALPPPLTAPLATTIGVVATDATLTKAQAAKVAGIGHDGLARAVDPVHTMLDGDTLFTLATGHRPAPGVLGMHLLLTAAGRCVTRAVGRALLAATSVTTPAGTLRSYRDAFPSAVPSATPSAVSPDLPG